MKSDLRNKIRRLRQALPKQTVHHHSKIICDTLIELPCYQQATHIACYSAIQNEVDLITLIEHALQTGKQVYLPVIADIDNHMHFHPFDTDGELRHNRFQILEPASELNLAIEPKQLELIIMPLVVFDPDCHRIGQGGGYYDTYLQHSTATRIGVAYEMQKIDYVRTDSWDIKPHMIVTESDIYLSATQPE